jgi:tRNA nucleotidyltransferase (CCA-adding enzyme)
MVTRLALEDTILATLRPTLAEREHVCGIAKRLLDAIAKSGKAKGMVVGSIARNTWVRGDRDLDVFMLFDVSLTREQLEEEGLSLARKIALKFSKSFHEKYAEHPYINAVIDDVDVDIVPCYNVDSATKIQSAVDRTPFHTRYITDKINGLIDDVLLLKRFTKAGGIYGSDQMTEGFSGYLCELLVLYYGGFTPLLKATVDWHPHMIIDPEHHGAKEFDEPLIVIDPVDPRRNVAAAVSLDRMVEFVELAGGYLEAPAEKYFLLPPPQTITKEELAELLAKRGTGLYAITFTTPPYIEEVIVPQLKRSMIAIVEYLDRNGFAVHHAHYTMEEERCMFLMELLVTELPSVRIHTGPPLWNRTNAEKFREKHVVSPLPGPYINEGKYEMEVPREFTRVEDLLKSETLLQVRLGKHVRQVLANGWELQKGAECWHGEFAPFIAGFFDRCSPLVRVKRK